MSTPADQQTSRPIIIDKKSHIIVKNVLSNDLCELLASYANLKATMKSNTRKDMLKNVHREYGEMGYEQNGHN